MCIARPVASVSHTSTRNTPRAWGRRIVQGGRRRGYKKHPHERGEDLQLDDTAYRFFRNTPTSVGKTPQQQRRTSAAQKHPHERGEDLIIAFSSSSSVETPPRAWGRPYPFTACCQKQGNTPTSVGKTVPWQFPLPALKKHPHERGEDRRGWFWPFYGQETPPRAWGRLASASPISLGLHFLPT